MAEVMLATLCKAGWQRVWGKARNVQPNQVTAKVRPSGVAGKHVPGPRPGPYKEPDEGPQRTDARTNARNARKRARKWGTT